MWIINNILINFKFIFGIVAKPRFWVKEIIGGEYMLGNISFINHGVN